MTIGKPVAGSESDSKSRIRSKADAPRCNPNAARGIIPAKPEARQARAAGGVSRGGKIFFAVMP